MYFKMVILLLSSATFCLSTAANADSKNKDERANAAAFTAEQYNERNDRNERQYDRRERQERGVQRLKQHRWQMGYVMPQHYRGDGYKVEYREFNLPKPSRNQQWYKINNDFILVESDSNSIVRIVGF